MKKARANEAKLPDYWRAGEQRLAAAEYLFRGRTSLLDAMYLSGYAVECALKALIVSGTPVRQRAKLLEEFRGEKGHSFDFLKKKLRDQRLIGTSESIPGLREIATWSTNLRYEAGFRRYDDAQVFIESARLVRDWAKKRI